AIRKQILPTRDINKAVNVKIRIRLRQIASVDEKNQAIRLVVWLRFQWVNPFLTWNASEFGGIKSVHGDNDLFWVPDVALFNQAGLEDEIEILHKRISTKLIITNDGNCTWNTPITLTSQCRIDVSLFPFDKQECKLQIGSWTYSGHKVKVTSSEKNVDMVDFIRSGEWEVESAVLSNHFTYYGPEHIPYPDITLTLKIKRRSLYYGLQIIVPMTVISLLAMFNVYMSVDEGLLSNMITLVVAISVYAIIISSKLPETSDNVPVLEKYCLGILLTVFLTSIYGPLMLMFKNASTNKKRMNCFFSRLTKFIRRIRSVFGRRCKCRKSQNVDNETNGSRNTETIGGDWEILGNFFRRSLQFSFWGCWVGFHAYVFIMLLL
ncbi:neuronal acetylcholine receptor subunit alpha-9-like, partial [Dendronephthya gigantea]|uniref:neuronal acetylcholine receptor subunit alpha-9-like n=1 Tax=Dendronephthya gigantea TaxID=151771 RepID=UPI001068E296